MIGFAAWCERKRNPIFNLLELIDFNFIRVTIRGWTELLKCLGIFTRFCLGLYMNGVRAITVSLRHSTGTRHNKVRYKLNIHRRRENWCRLVRSLGFVTKKHNFMNFWMNFPGIELNLVVTKNIQHWKSFRRVDSAELSKWNDNFNIEQLFFTEIDFSNEKAQKLFH